MLQFYMPPQHSCRKALKHNWESINRALKNDVVKQNCLNSGPSGFWKDCCPCVSLTDSWSALNKASVFFFYHTFARSCQIFSCESLGNSSSLFLSLNSAKYSKVRGGRGGGYGCYWHWDHFTYDINQNIGVEKSQPIWNWKKNFPNWTPIVWATRIITSELPQELEDLPQAPLIQQITIGGPASFIPGSSNLYSRCIPRSFSLFSFPLFLFHFPLFVFRAMSGVQLK